MTGTIYSGILPVVPTTFTETGDLDLESQRRALDCMVDQGVDGACILANFSEQFLLTDEERDTEHDAQDVGDESFPSGVGLAEVRHVPDQESDTGDSE